MSRREARGGWTRRSPAPLDGGDIPDGSIYDRPATNRISPASLGLSIAVVLAATAMYVFVLLMFV